MQAASQESALAHGRRVLALRRALAGYDGGLASVPVRLRAVIETASWLRFQLHAEDAVSEHTDFAHFVGSVPPCGLGTDLRLLARLCADDVATLDLLDRESTRHRGAPRRARSVEGDDQGGGAIGLRACQGNTRQYALRRLRRAEPELHRQVVAGECSVHHAMVLAGIRRATVCVPLDTERAASILIRRFPREALHGLVETLSDLCACSADESTPDEAKGAGRAMPSRPTASTCGVPAAAADGPRAPDA